MCGAPPVAFIKNDLSALKEPLSRIHSIHKEKYTNLIQLCIYSARLYNNIDVKHVKIYHIYVD
jgi:hypothetical protein